MQPSDSRRASLLPLVSLLFLSLQACTGESTRATPADDGGVGSTEHAITAQPDPTCTYGRLGVHDYWSCSTAKNFNAAKSTCESVGMHLVRIDTAAENDFVLGQLGADAWIGATDSAAEGSWRWVNDNAQFWSGNRPGSAVGGLYNKWTSVEPNDLFGEDCGVMVKSSGQWNDIPCSLARAFVCESSPATNGQPQAPDTACTRTTRNGSTYWTCSNARSWDTARANCQSIGMDLVAIDDAAEAAALLPSFTRETYLGLADKEEEGVWRWAATKRASFCGTSGGKTPYGSYSNWAQGQPYRANNCERVVSGSRAHWICRNDATWMAADQECRGSGMSLARIDDDAENALLASKITKDTWLGGNDRAAEGVWRWSDQVQFWSSSLHGPVGSRYANFQVGEPNDLFGENCLLMYQVSGRWNDSICEAPLGGIGFACEGAANSGYPDRNDCAYAKSGGTWSSSVCSVPRAYVCESVPAGANVPLDELTSQITETHSSGALQVMGFQFKPGTQVKEPFAGREERLGLRTCEDSLEPSGTPAIVRSTGLERATYDQKYRGIRVFGRGYTVMRDKTSKNVASVLGEIAPQLAVNTTPSVSEATALTRATAAIGRTPSSYTPTPRGELVLFPKKQGKDPNWELTWLFVLPKRGSTDGHTVAISALSGTTLMALPDVRQCTTGPLPAPYLQQPMTLDVYQRQFFGDPNSALSTTGTGTTAPPATLPTYLNAVGTSLDGTHPLFGKPEISATCAPVAMTPGTSRLPVMRVPASPIVYDSTPGAPTEEETGAAMFLAVHTSLNTFSQLFKLGPDTVWRGIDGPGTRRIDLEFSPGISRYVRATAENREYIHFDTRRRAPAPGASLDVAAHELGHALWYTFAPMPSDLEVAAVQEGFSDIMGASVEAASRGPVMGNVPETGAYCMDGDQQLNQPGTCVIDFAQPINSTLGCRLVDASGNVVRQGCPQDFRGSDYCTSENRCPTNAPDCCDEHFNSTVFSHWYYLVSAGSSQVTPNTCPYRVEPLSQNSLQSAALASNVVFNALRDQEWNNLQYKGVAEATIAAARKMFSSEPAKVQTIVSAWHAVNVREDVTGDPGVYPKRGAEKVNPWVTFAWRVAKDVNGNDETAWDFQLDDNNFQGSTVLFEKRNVTTATGTPKSAYLAMALPEKSTKHYVWRVRPHSDAAWSDCYAIHWFDGTGPIPQPTVKLGTVDQTTGQLQPGTAFVYFSQLPMLPEGIGGYNVQLSQQNVACVDTQGVPRIVEPTITPVVTETGSHAVPFNGIQPQVTYYAHVQAIGPPSIADGKPALGPCVTESATTGAPTTPVIYQPANGQRFNLYAPHQRDPEVPSGPEKLELRFSLDSWMKSARVTFRKRNADGTCAAAIENTMMREAPSTCANESTCYVTIADVPFQETPFPGGYCWEVVGLGQGGAPVSPPVQSSWRYYVDVSPNRSPGVPAASRMPAPLPGNPFNSRDMVTFDWDPVPGAAGYGMKIWQWTQAYGTEQLGNTQVYPTQGGTTAMTDANHTELGVSGIIAGKGRYCWELYPMMEDPATPGVALPAELQPKVSAGGPLCYTSGPALPIIRVDNEPPARGYTGQDVTGEVEFPYVPDSQYIANVGPDWTWEPTTEPWCTTLNQVYKDIVNCKRKFRIKAVEGKTVDMSIAVYGGSEAAGTKPSGTPVHTAKRTVRFGRCGGSGEACCPGTPRCDDQKLACDGSSTCVGCGIVNAPCCLTGTACNAPLACDGTKHCTMPCPSVATPSGLSPGSADWCYGDEINFLEPTYLLQWTPVPGATKYEVTVTSRATVSISTDCVVPDVNLSTNTYTTTDPFITVPLPVTFGRQGVTWSVVASNSCGQKSQAAPPSNLWVEFY